MRFFDTTYKITRAHVAATLLGAVLLLLAPLFVHAQAVGAVLDFLGEEVLGGVVRFFMWIFFKLTGFFMTSGAFMLDLSISKGIDSSLINSLSSIDAAWTILRDLANMFFIFIMLYIAIATILQLGNVQWKQALARLIIIALLINFSLFFTKVIIDASNMLAVGFYNGIQTEVTTTSGTITVYGPSTMILGSMKLQTLFSASEWAKADMTNLDIALLLFFGSIFQAIAGFVFFTGAFIFLIRLITFIFLMILSPLAFVGMILPNVTGQYSTKWWKKLLENAFLAPAFLAMLFVVSTILNSGDIFNISGASAKGFLKTIASGGTEGGYEIFFNFAIVIGLLWGTIEVAKAISGGVTQSSMIWAKKLTGAGVAGGATAAALAGRYTLGAAGKAASENTRLREMANKGGFSGFAARQRLNLYDKAASSSFDARNTAAGRAATDALGKQGISSTAGSRLGEGGYRKNIAATTTEKWRQGEERVARMAATDATGKPIEFTRPARDKDGKEIAGKTETVSASTVAAERFEDKAKSSSSTARKDYHAMEKRMRAGDKEAEELAKRANVAKRKEQVKGIENNVKTLVDTDPTKIETELRNLSPQEIASFDADTLANPDVARHFDVRTLSALAKKGDLNLTSAQRDAIREAATKGPHGLAAADWFENDITGKAF